MPVSFSKNKKHTFEILFFIVIIVLSELYFFRNYLPSDRLIGDYADGRLINLICEHWFAFFSGKTSLFELPIFYPAKHILGYSDLLLGFALPYSLFRFCGIDMFLSAKFAIITVHAIGTIFYYGLLRFKLGASKPASLLALVLFTLSSAFSVQVYHVQLLWLSQLPILFLFLFNFFEQRDFPHKRVVWGVLFVLSFGLIFLTSFYIGMFLLVFLFLSFIFCLFTGLFPKMLRGLKHLGLKFYEMALYLFSALLWAIPFIAVYFPALNFFGVRKWDSVVSANPAWFDIINSSPYNFLWGRIMCKVEPYILIKPDAQELCSGFPVLTLVFGLISCVYILSRYSSASSVNYQEKFFNTISFIFWGAFLLSLVLLIRVENYTLWYYFFKYFPGCSAIRVFSRYLLFLTFPVSFFCAFTLNDLSKRIFLRPWVWLLLIVLFADNIFAIDKNLYFAPRCYYTWSRSAMKDFLAQVSPPPRDCRVFYMKNDPFSSDVRFRHLDAWMIANKYGLKTINGYSGQYPRTLYLAEINSRMYLRSIRRWVVIHKLSNIFSYDLKNKVWKDFDKENLFELYIPGTRITATNISVPLFESLMANGWTLGTPGVFTSQADCAEMIFDLPETPEKVNVIFTVSSKDSDKVLLLINGKAAGEFGLSEKPNQYSVKFPFENVKGRRTVLISFCNPKTEGEMNDYIYKPSNSWSFFLHSITVEK